MKALSRFTIVALWVAAASMASCLGGNDYETISQENYQSYLSLMVGTYSNGCVYYVNDSSQVDTLLGLRAVVSSDSIIRFRGVPSYLLSKCITTNDELKAAIEESPDQDIIAGFVFSNADGANVYFYVYPVSVSYAGLEYGGSVHDVDIILYPLNTYYPSGTFLMDSYAIDFTVLINAVYLDGVPYESFYDDYSDTNELRNAMLQFHASRF